jgi:RHS repeat-associated protein
VGRWAWTWDAAGNLDTQTDARGRRLTFTHDVLNRLETKRYQNGTQVVWQYDEAGHGAGIGRLTSIADPTGKGCAAGRSRSLVYDSAGQVTKDTNCVDGDTQTMRLEFDQLGRQKAVTYPDGERQAYGYDTAGRLRDMPGLIGEFEYDADGHTTKTERADSTITTWTWDPKRRWLNEIATASPVTGPLLKLGYTYEPDGLVKTITASPGGPNLSFTYDGLDRLTDVKGDLSQQFIWNTIGNLTTNSTVGTYTYPTSGPSGCTRNGNPGPCRRPHAASRAGGETYDYDANGNTTAIHTTNQLPKLKKLKQYAVKAKRPSRRRDTLWAIAAEHLGDPLRWREIFALNKGRPYPRPPGGRFNNPHLIYPGQRLLVPAGRTGSRRAKVTSRHLVWDDDNRLAMLQDRSGKWTRMRYDAGGDRVEKRQGNKVAHYFGPWLEDGFPGPGTTKYYWAGSTLIARRDRRGLHFYHQDHLGSTRMLTTGDGRISARYSYQPFGAPLQHTGSTSTGIQFTGQRRDDEHGHVLMGARYYDPTRARFLSPDTIIPDPNATQAANRYAYTYGNPLGWIDPTGYEPEECSICEFEAEVIEVGGSSDPSKSDPSEWAPWPYDEPTEHDKLTDPPLIEAAEPTSWEIFTETLRLLPEYMVMGSEEKTKRVAEVIEREGAPPELANPLASGWLNRICTYCKFLGGLAGFHAGRGIILPSAQAPYVTIRGLPARPAAPPDLSVVAARIQNVLKANPIAHRQSVTAVVSGTNSAGQPQYVVANNTGRLSPAQRALAKELLGENVIFARGTGHAEPQGLQAATEAGLTPTGVGASKACCTPCCTAVGQSPARLDTPPKYPQ